MDLNLNLFFNTHLSDEYKSKSQIARVLTEDWVSRNSYCLSCGNMNLEIYKRNNPAADFYCGKCSADYELKSFKILPKLKIVDGAYDSMVNKISSNNNSNFFFLHYSSTYSVLNYFTIPKFFFTKEIIEKRNPLSENARRAYWVGCNILYGNIPKTGIIYIIKDGKIVNREIVVQQWKKTSFLSNQNLSNRGWTIECLGLIDKIITDKFTINDVYKFEELLKQKYPNNRFIKEKIRQQLQVLRDRGLIKFIGKGLYQKGELYERK